MSKGGIVVRDDVLAAVDDALWVFCILFGRMPIVVSQQHPHGE
jgi:hypothetical protein